MKSLHRQIVMSRTYRQASTTNDQSEMVDPENSFYSRFPARRMEAEMIRDCLLTASGVLNLKRGGPAVEFVDPGNRQIVVATPMGPGPHEVDRRSVYIRHRRTTPLAFLQVFDQATPEPNCPARSTATVVAQSLALINSDFAVRMGREFSSRLQKEAGAVPEDQIKLAFQIVFGRNPDGDELNRSIEFLHQQTELHREARPMTSTDLLRTDYLADFCRMLTASNEFLQVQ